MKKWFFVTAFLFIGVFVITSCKKNRAIPEVQDKLYGTWNLDSMVTVFNVKSDTTRHVEKNSSYYIKLDLERVAEMKLSSGEPRFFYFSRLGDSEITIGNTDYKISDFTEKTMKLYHKEIRDNYWSEVKISLRK